MIENGLDLAAFIFLDISDSIVANSVIRWVLYIKTFLIVDQINFIPQKLQYYLDIDKIESVVKNDRFTFVVSFRCKEFD